LLGNPILFLIVDPECQNASSISIRVEFGFGFFDFGFGLDKFLLEEGASGFSCLSAKILIQPQEVSDMQVCDSGG